MKLAIEEVVKEEMSTVVENVAMKEEVAAEVETEEVVVIEEVAAEAVEEEVKKVSGYSLQVTG